MNDSAHSMEPNNTDSEDDFPRSPKTIKRIGFHQVDYCFRFGNFNHPKFGGCYYLNSLGLPGKIVVIQGNERSFKQTCESQARTFHLPWRGRWNPRKIHENPGKLTWTQKWRFGSDTSPFPSGVIFCLRLEKTFLQFLVGRKQIVPTFVLMKNFLALMIVTPPSLPVIPPEVNGVWMVCFLGSSHTSKNKVFGSLRTANLMVFFVFFFRFQLSKSTEIFSTSTAAANCFTNKKSLWDWPSFWGSLSKEPEHSRKPLIWWLQKNDSKQQKKMQLLRVEVCQVGRSGLTCWWLACG